MEAEKAGISVSDEEVTAQMKEIFGYTGEESAEGTAGLESFNVTDSAGDEADPEQKDITG